MGSAWATHPGRNPWWSASQDRHALCDERDPLSPADRLPLALLAAGRLSTALDGVQHLPQVPGRQNVGLDLGSALPDVAGAGGPRRLSIGRDYRQPDNQVGRKRGSKAQISTADAADAVGYDAGKKLKGRKIHSFVDTLGLPIRLVVHSAGIQDRDGAALLFDKIKQRFPWLECVFADTGYNAQQTFEAASANSLRLEIVRRNPSAVGFEVIKRRWIVERTFSWFGRNRRLAKDVENLAATLLAFVTLAAIQFGIRRLAR